MVPFKPFSFLNGFVSQSIHLRAAFATTTRGGICRTSQCMQHVRINSAVSVFKRPVATRYNAWACCDVLVGVGLAFLIQAQVSNPMASRFPLISKHSTPGVL